MRDGSRSRVAVAVHVHPDLDHADELHQVGHGLPQPVTGQEIDAPAVAARADWPSGAPIVPSPFWSMPRPPAGNVTGRAVGLVTVSVLARAEAVPDGVDGDVAMPCSAIVAATDSGSTCPCCWLTPWPKIATGQPPAGSGRTGRNRLK